ncbi:prephenate dehydrogenase [Mariprofundus ferrooxydans]|uniref:Prephenate dehydrogenase n=1 Tax=Mariprofundus ferrooxydans PV-1 TaxID=314345 RepID=Q0EYT3_9PROT|nr:prephenate dehydrogenase/arogenate dehydrogenase family protein [Mariprofundus ferrooxydans]EAU54474.1 Prephenate dehydrogenase [Mariprofundus ferrooxydans PV-1]KON48398.1 prephenate dehydrogenase [Mariprofundus ferrooxydans]
MTREIRHLVVIGTGLIGGSVALALRRAGCVGRITGVGRSAENLQLAVDLGVIDDFSHDVAQAVADADMVLVSVPVSASADVFRAMAQNLPADAVITDAGSSKQSVMAAAAEYLPNPSRFVPAHPIAGTEESGAGAAFAELFDRHWCILTPDEATDADALARVRSLWEATGSRVMQMDAAAHDEHLAAVSHLPHVAAFALVNAVRKSGGDDPFRFAAGGFRDFTRIASSSPEMWRDIAMCNREALIAKLDALITELGVLRAAVDGGDADCLLTEFAAARAARDAWLLKYGDEL